MAPKVDPALHLLGGAGSGMVACTVLQPLDLIKTRLQQQRQDHLAFLREAKTKGLLVAPQKSNIYSTVRDIIRTNGPIGLWRGTFPTILRNVPGSAMYFFALAEMRSALATTRTTAKNPLQTWDNLLAGAAARGSVGFIMMPITVVKIRYESNFYNYKSLTDAFSSIVKNDGVRGLFAGYGATFIRDAPFAGIYLFFYEQCKSTANAWTVHNGVNVANAAINLGSGVLAGVTATCFTQPFDMLKTRMQLKPLVYRNLWSSAKKVIAEEGAIGFFDGISVRLIRKSLNSAVSWTIYEEIVRWHHNSQLNASAL
ncbi:mitochondrial carrier domain-containing protein [Umbelopsis sp. AD052]|nr:mitochondrial carrier domain-containing protein [Umbelopsis sp. AD052]